MNRAERRRYARSRTKDPKERKAIARALRGELGKDVDVDTLDLPKPSAEEKDPPAGVTRRRSGLIIARPPVYQPGRRERR